MGLMVLVMGLMELAMGLMLWMLGLMVSGFIPSMGLMAHRTTIRVNLRQNTNPRDRACDGTHGVGHGTHGIGDGTHAMHAGTHGIWIHTIDETHGTYQNNARQPTTEHKPRRWCW